MADQEKQFVHIVTNPGRYNTLDKIIEFYYEDEYTADDILNYADNKKFIYNRYDDELRKEHSEANKDVLVNGTVLVLPFAGRKLLLKYQRIDDLKQTNITLINETFWTDRVKNFLNDKINVYKQKNNEDYLLKRFNKYYVKVWSRVLNKVIYLTPDIENFSMSQADENGGTFNFSLQAITAKHENGNWVKDNIFEYDNNDNSFSKTSVVSSFKLDLFGFTSDVKLKFFNNLYYEKVLNPQDLVFIKLDEDFKERNDFGLDDDYDMIGLIDSIIPNLLQTEEKIEAMIKVTGRDLMKVFVEDGTHFFPFETYVGVDGSKPRVIAGGISQENLERVFGRLNDIELAGNRTLSHLLTFIIERLRNLDLEIPINGGVWNFVEFEIEPQTANRVLADSSIATMSGSIINFINSLLQTPFVETITDTYGSKFTFIIRTPPYLKEPYLNNRTLEISIRHLVQNSTGIDDRNVRSWFMFRPDASFFGDRDIAAALFPGIYFDKLAKIYGSRKLEMSHRYITYNYKDTTDKESRIDTKIQNVEDLKFMVEAFLPEMFMKKGSLTFRNVEGIKKGINIYIPELDMLYYVKSYSHQIEISERITQVEVERGMPLNDIDLFYSLVEVEIDRENNIVKNVKFDENVFDKLIKKYYE